MGDKSDRLRGISRGKGAPPRSRREAGGASSAFRGKQGGGHGGRENDDDFMSMEFTELEGLDSEAMMDGGPAAEKMVDADFFNRFGDPFDESDMKAEGSHEPTQQKPATPLKKLQAEPQQ